MGGSGRRWVDYSVESRSRIKTDGVLLCAARHLETSST